MARLRTIKPGFFTNDQLAEVSPIGRLLFAGLWCLADREGRLEDRPKRIKVEVLPYDGADVDKLLDELARRGFIRRYAASGQRYIEVQNFLKHQSPHVKESPSLIPAPGEPDTDPNPSSAGTGPAPDEHSENTVLAPPVVGSSSGEWDPGVGSSSEIPGGSAPPVSAQVEEVWAHFKSKIQPKARLVPRKRIAARLKRFTVAELIDGIDHFAVDWWWMEHNAQRGGDWFFESDARSEQFLLLEPRPPQGQRIAAVPPPEPEPEEDWGPDVVADEPPRVMPEWVEPEVRRDTMECPGCGQVVDDRAIHGEGCEHRGAWPARIRHVLSKKAVAA